MYETVVCPNHQVWKLVHLTEKDPLKDVSQLVDMLPNIGKMSKFTLEERYGIKC